MKNDVIKIYGARENNLKNIDITLPKNSLIVMTGISGSGKSSLAFDTLYQEGRRRYVESLSAYARQFLGSFEKPKVDRIDGLSPSISIDQKSTSNNPRSTVGTITEIYDYFRLLYSKIGTPYNPFTGEALKKHTILEMTDTILNFKEGTKFVIIAPIIKNQAGNHKKVLEKYLKDGFSRVMINGNEYYLEELPKMDLKTTYSIGIIVDRLINKPEIESRLYESLELATNLSNGRVEIKTDEKTYFFNEHYTTPEDNFEVPDLEPRLFSFNTPLGACPNCNGLGVKMLIDPELVIDREKKLLNGGLVPYKNAHDESLNLKEIEQVANFYNVNLNKTVGELSEKEINYFLYGSPDKIDFLLTSAYGNVHNKKRHYEGIVNNLQRRYIETQSEWIREWIEGFMREQTCQECYGARLNKAALSVKIGNKNIYELTVLTVEKISEFFNELELSEVDKNISELAIVEIKSRLKFLENVGLGYLTLARKGGTLSGGEAQRIRLATQVGTSLSGVLYVLDEPSIGLHQKDNEKLINTLKNMRDLGNTLIVVEHDEETMLNADYLVDIGPGAGESGGYVVAKGSPKEVMDNPNSLTGQYLKGIKKIDVPKSRRNPNNSFIEVKGACENNLKEIDVNIPIGLLTVVSGVSGSGKSTLVNEILLKGLKEKYYKKTEIPGKHKSIDDHGLIDKVVEISQDPIGRTPRSNPATYTGVFDGIRDVFSKTKESLARGYNKGRFSFNVKGGRCETCRGDGVKKITMHFLPDVYVKCESCQGARYNRETLQIKYRGKSISDILEMTVEEGVVFFENHPKIYHQLKTLQDVGLSYIKLGQSSVTLSGGEAQRIKLASELQKKITNRTIFILDEPTTGLHSDDVKKLIKVLQSMVDSGATMVVIEHNLDVIKSADYIIDLGPDGGDKGGEVIALGTPEEVSKNSRSYTGKYLLKVLNK